MRAGARAKIMLALNINTQNQRCESLHGELAKNEPCPG